MASERAPSVDRGRASGVLVRLVSRPRRRAADAAFRPRPGAEWEMDMRGPKGARLVTREEVEALCRDRIATFEHVATELERFAKRSNLWTKDLEVGIATKRRALLDLFDGHSWVRVQRQAAVEAEFLRRETERMKAAVVAQAADPRSEGRVP